MGGQTGRRCRRVHYRKEPSEYHHFYQLCTDDWSRTGIFGLGA